MDRCKRSFSAFLILLCLLVESGLAKEEDKNSSLPAPILDATKNGSLDSPRVPLNSTDGSPNLPSSAPLPGPTLVNSTVHSPLLPSANETSKLLPPPPPSNVTGKPPNLVGPPVKPPPTSGIEPPAGGNKSEEEEKKNGDGDASLSNSTSSGIQKCGSSNTTCWGSLVACLWHPPNDSKKQFLILQNEGENTLTVTATIHPNRDVGVRTIAKKSIEKVPIPMPADATHSLEIVLTEGEKTCSFIEGAPVTGTNFFQQLPMYSTQVTPVHGAYAIFLTALVVGGIWGCLKLAKWSKRTDTGVPYQQLEMGTQAQSTTVVETGEANGWDQWDDDWDEEAVSRPPQKQQNGDDATNGHSVDGWEDWDD